MRIVPVPGPALCAAPVYMSMISLRISPVIVYVCLAVCWQPWRAPVWVSATELAGEHVGGAGSILNAGARRLFTPISDPYIVTRAGWTLRPVALTAVLEIYFADGRPVVRPAQPGFEAPQATHRPASHHLAR